MLAALIRDLLVAALALGVALSIACLVIVVIVYRRIRRAAPVRRTLLAVRAQALPPGPARSLAQLRRSVHRSVRSTRDCVESARARGQRVNDLPRSVARLGKAARLLDHHLRDLEREVDPVRQAGQLPAARERVRQLTSAAAVVRGAVCATTDALGDVELRALSSDVDRQALRLSTYDSAYRELQRSSEA
ncbi:MAG: hypothetical protein NVSMB29_19510 [Candidatus Dormibacteria bacterium]